jgi:ABC-2 type transport system permease protein
MSETRILTTRAWRLTMRNVEGLMIALGLPVILMLVIVYLFGGAIRTGRNYVDYVVPGVLLVCVGFGAATTAVSVADDLGKGVIDRLRAMDVGGASLIGSHVVASVARNLASTLLVVAVAFGIGFRPTAGLSEWFSAVAVLTAFVLALSWLAAAIGVVTRSPEAANGVTFLITFLPYASSAFVPISTMPGPVQAFASRQPVTAVVDSLRGLLLGGGGGSIGTALLWSGGLTAGSIALASVLFRIRYR